MNHSNRTSVLLSLLEQPRILPGFINGYRQPVGFARLRVASCAADQMQSLQHAFEHYFAAFLAEIRTIKSSEDILLMLGDIVAALQRTAGLPIFDEVKLMKKNSEFMLWIPTLFDHCYHQAMVFTIQLINYYAAQKKFVTQQVLSGQITQLINNLKTNAPQGSNSRRLLAAAHHNNIPWMHVSQNIYQYGYGCQSRWFDSTFTDNTSQLGAKLARSKICTLSLLRKAGLPVPEQHVVKSADDAAAKAKKMGYPVVIKPFDQDGGRGVSAQLMSEDRLRKAYELAKSFSAMVILEKHIFGKDYRLLVLNGELIWAVERIPPHIIGDGINDIAGLIKLANEQSGRSNEEHATLKFITVTTDMTEYLHEQRFNLDSVPASGQMVQLNPVANISTGGVPVGVMERVHPDNKRLIETAVSLLRLDIAGVDFIIPDIQQSYLETHSSIIEVNSQPQLGTITAPHIYKQVLNTLLPQHGRIPIIVIWGGASQEAVISDLRQNLASEYEYIGIARKNIAYVNADEIIQAPSLFAAANSLLFNKQVELLIYCVNQADEVAVHGLPFDRFDYLFFLDAPDAESDFGLLDTLFKACLHQPVLHEDIGANNQLMMQSIASVPFKTNHDGKLARSVMLALTPYFQGVSDLAG